VTEERETHNEITNGIFFSTVLQGRDITVYLPTEVFPALSGLPVSAQSFTGRDVELQTLMDILALTAGNGAPSAPADDATMVVINGMAGIGKTELAVQAARVSLGLGWFPGGVLFVDMSSYDPRRRIDASQALEGFLRALGIAGEHIPPLEQDRIRLYTSVLAAYARSNRRILVIIDNVSTHEHAALLLPSDGINAAIVTSRDRLCMLKARQLSLDVLTPEAAIAVLDQILRVAHPGDTRIRDYPADAALIAELCGRLPLALQITGALLADDLARPLVAMATDLSEAGSRLDELQYEDIAVAAAFDLSYQRLDPELARLFRLLPVNPGPYISTDTAAALFDVSQVTVRRRLEALARAHLIEHAAGYGYWRMHDLVRLYADQRGRNQSALDRRKDAFTRLLRHYLVDTQAAIAHLDPQVQISLGHRFSNRDQALEWLDLEFPNLIAASRIADFNNYATIARDLPLALWKYLLWRRRFYDWVSLSTIARKSARHLGDQHGEAIALNSLGIALQGTRRFEDAITALQEATQIFPETGDRHGEAMALNNLGVALRKVRRFEEAAAAFQQAARAFHDSGDRHGEGIALGSLGYVARFAISLTGPASLQDSAEFFESSSHDQSDAARDERAIGNGWFIEAISALQDGAQAFRDTGDRHGEGRAREILGIVLGEVGRPAEALDALQEAIHIFRDSGDRHREGVALSDLGIVLWATGQDADAEVALQESVQIFRDIEDRYSETAILKVLAIAPKEQEPTQIIKSDREARRFRSHGHGWLSDSIGLDIPDLCVQPMLLQSLVVESDDGKDAER
jgi:tetratricopeptide (TPR) repeat protein